MLGEDNERLTREKDLDTGEVDKAPKQIFLVIDLTT